MALEKTNDLEQYTRKSSVRIFGLEDEKNEEIAITIAKVNNLLNDKILLSNLSIFSVISVVISLFTLSTTFSRSLLVTSFSK
jgi:hypothetical protein